jgi:hypothetical protein
MYEKNVVSRNVAIALAAISIVLFAGLVGEMSYNVFIINERSNETIASLHSQVASLQNDYSQLANDYDQLTASYDWYQTAYNQLLDNYSIEATLRIGTTLETYYDYVRANVVSLGSEPLSEERWYDYPNYYSNSVTFAAYEAAHDAGNAYWPTMETGSNYYEITGEHADDTANIIMEQAIIFSGVKASDSDVDKIDKILGFIHSQVEYQSKLLDHMWFPTETLMYKSGDCTSFSILAACMFEKVGIKAAIGFFTYQDEAHAMVLVRLDDLGDYGYCSFPSLTSYGLSASKWIVIEPQYSSLSQYSSNLDWVHQWGIVAACEVIYGV